MKRIVTFLLGLLLVFAACTAMAETVTVKPGDELTIDISLTSASGTDAKVGIKTNGAPVTFVSATGGPTNDVVPPKAFDGFFVLLNDEGITINNKGTSISGTPTGPVALETGVIGKLTFQINAAAPSGTYTVEAYKKEGSIKVKGSVTFTVEGTSGARVPGDADENGVVTTTDARLIMQWIAGYDVTINENNANCDGDGAVTTTDARIIMQSIAGYDVVLK